MKRIVTMLLVLSMVMSIGSVAFAEETKDLNPNYVPPYKDIVRYTEGPYPIPYLINGLEDAFNKEKLTAKINAYKSEKIIDEIGNQYIKDVPVVEDNIIIVKRGQDRKYYVYDYAKNNNLTPYRPESFIESYTRLLFDYPVTEIVSINGVPWQETEWKDLIIQSAKSQAYPGDLINNPTSQELLLHPEANGKAGDLWEQVETEGKTLREVLKSIGVTELKTNPPGNTDYNLKAILKLNSKNVTYFGIVKGLKTIDAAPFTVNNVTLIPLRGVIDRFGAELDWDASKRQVTVKDGNNLVELNIDSKKAIVNGKEVQLLQPATIKNNRTLIPLRFVSESMGYNVDWNGATKEITIIQ